MSVKKTKISALAIIYNEEHNIREYLDNMSFADEIIIVDSYSTDATPKIVIEEYPHVKFYQRVFDDFSSQRNYTLDLASYDWVTFFDADERVSKKGIAEIIKTIDSEPEEVAYVVKRVFFYEGRPLINNIFNADKIERIFRRSKCRYTKKLVHEKLDIHGKTGELKVAIDHYTFKTKEEFLNKRLQYSQLKAKELLDKHITPTYYHLSIRPKFRFFKYYILKLGFLNGSRGYGIARILQHDEYMRYIYLQEMQEAKDGGQAAKKILVIQQKMIGDVLVSTILCNNLKKAYPKSEIHYLIYPFTKPVVEGNPNIDKIILFESEYRDSKWKFFKFLLQTRKEKYDIVIDAYGKLESNLIVAFSRADKKIGFYKPYTSYIYTHTVNEIKQPVDNAGLAINNRLELLSALNLTIELDRKPKIFMSGEEREHGKEVLLQHGITPGTTVYMIGVLGSSKTKTYPYAYMAQLLDVIGQKPNVCLLFNYIPVQKKEAEAIYNLCSDFTKQKIRMDIVPGGVREFLSILSQCDAIIGNEGGAVNMAKAIDIPSFTIFSTWIKKEAWNSFENGKSIVSVHLKDYKPELYGDNSPKEMKPQALRLYEEFTPDLIVPLLKEYIAAN
ncbi:glycosyltransferase [Flavobacterium zepuense]|uniref:Glycosyltransferase n=1 Tax=Flavobacterium zepuense TaxID=2593302 RepID=A0A552UXU5_9FLAO|nr:glycosyltransferase [Flavobacterium zepuense]TRW23044.1 glycosyltransferase [Flavobacterium zepuense]